jgi:hypothetical protein
MYVERSESQGRANGKTHHRGHGGHRGRTQRKRGRGVLRGLRSRRLRDRFLSMSSFSAAGADRRTVRYVVCRRGMPFRLNLSSLTVVDHHTDAGSSKGGLQL